MLSILLPLVLSSPAHAWRHTGAVWVPGDDFPVRYQSDARVGTVCVGELDGADCAATLAQSYQDWSDAACTSFAGVDDGFLASEVGALGDGINGVRFVDDLAPGVLGETRYSIDGAAFTRDGVDYYRLSEADVVFAADAAWATDAQVALGDCVGESNLRAVVGHELGHLAGLGHSCEVGESCGDPDLRDALMYWAADACDLDATPQADDVAGLEALYGTRLSVQCGTSGLESVLGVAPLTLNCVVGGDSLIDEASWSFGDGTTALGITQTHTWAEEGLYTVIVNASGTDAECGPFDEQVVRKGYVRACEEPEASFHLDHLVGTKYALQNDTEINVVGCITGVHWAIYEGGKVAGKPYAELENWEFDYTFAEPGEWTVVLNVGGPGGVTAARVTLDVRTHAGVNAWGCSHSGGPVQLGALFLVFLGVLRRR